MSGFDFSEQGKPLGQALALESSARIRAEAERDALREALNAGNLSGETPEIRAWCGVVLSNLERPE